MFVVTPCPCHGFKKLDVVVKISSTNIVHILSHGRAEARKPLLDPRSDRIYYTDTLTNGSHSFHSNLNYNGLDT